MVPPFSTLRHKFNILTVYGAFLFLIFVVVFIIIRRVFYRNFYKVLFAYITSDSDYDLRLMYSQFFVFILCDANLVFQLALLDTIK
jgi:hypothetical protein